MNFAAQPDVVGNARALMPSSLSPRYKQIVVVGVGKPERVDDNDEIPSGVLGGFIALSSPEGCANEGRSGQHDGGTWVVECGCCGSMPSEPVPSELHCSTRQYCGHGVAIFA